MAEKQRVGRPRRSSRRMLEEAAAELFLEQTYDGTTIDEISTRAGVSRNTFFNYFSSKSDVLWVDVDETISALSGILASLPRHENVLDGVEAALTRVASEHPSSRVPWALTQVDLMGTRNELLSSGMVRVLAVTEILASFISSRAGADVKPDGDTAAAALTAAAATAAARWAGDGVGRRALDDYVREAIGPVCSGFRPCFDGAGAQR
ncbi:TetR/AcrR family transcriptional regulator [Paramicrobacterium agarici]|uniref:TetR family transcriptional regulator n=1 Tax=Paramicrobacterium agarici TaxID=630514 RepID=A0A2A9DYU7_9MICO|nr:TetR/AcrR family transcriptional regulator [Microbacterium agarici]PFG31152.1 TetR family transcriptional regulator [Microbacterium agarici]